MAQAFATEGGLPGRDVKGGESVEVGEASLPSRPAPETAKDARNTLGAIAHSDSWNIAVRCCVWEREFRGRL